MPALGPLAITRTRRARVLTVDDQAPFLAVLRDLVSATLGLESVAEANSGERAIEAVKETKPDIVLMDVWMPGMGGLAAARFIKAARPSTFVVLVSTMHPDEIAMEPDAVGADAVIWKSELAPRLLDDLWRRYRDQHTSTAL